jgi:hypothetical protein
MFATFITSLFAIIVLTANTFTWSIRNVVLCCLLQYLSYFMAISFIGRENGYIMKKTTDMLQVTDNRSHDVVSNTAHNRWASKLKG